MTIVSPSIADLARRILALEAARANADIQVDEAVRACAKLQVPLSKFTGPAGFLSILSRALVLAKAEVPSLRVVQVRSDGSVVGFDEIKHDQDAGTLAEGRTVLVAHVLGLLATFIGESLTRRLASDAWPDASLDSPNMERNARP